MAASTTTTTTPTKMTSYFFIFDFYHMKGAGDDVDLLPESIVFFHPGKEDFKRQKLLDCGELVGLIQYFKYDLFTCVPSEFHFKKSLVTTKHFGRHCAFLILSRDRFTTDESNVHLEHILNTFHMLYGTWNHIQTSHPEINQIQSFLNQTLAPIVEHVFNENRTIQNIFSAIDYAPLKRNNQRCLLHIKHLLNHLKITYGVKAGLIAYEKKILHSSFDIDTTFYVQVLLGLEQKLSANEIYFLWKSELKLKNGVSLIRIYITRSPSLEPILNAVNANTTYIPNPQILSKPIDIIVPLLSSPNEIASLNCCTNSIDYSLSISDKRRDVSIVEGDPAGSPTETSFDTDQTESVISPHTEDTRSISSYGKDNESVVLKKPIEHYSKSPLSIESRHGSTDDEKRNSQYKSSRSPTISSGFEELPRKDQQSCLNDRDDQIIIELMKSDDYNSDSDEKDIILLPPMSLFPTSCRGRSRTVTNTADMNYGERFGNDPHEGHVRWGDMPNRNDENERDEFVLYVQRNSRMMFAGIIEQNTISDEYLQNLWSFMLSEMAEMDTEIQVTPVSEEAVKLFTDVKFQHNENIRCVQFEHLLNANHYHRKTPSADNVCMAFNARSKLNLNSERKMVGFSRGNNMITVNRYLPDRVTYSCRRFQELQ